MAWVAVHKDGEENIFTFKPYRRDYNHISYKLYKPTHWTDEYVSDYGNEYTGISLPKGTIKKIIGRDLTWEDEPVELKEKHP